VAGGDTARRAAADEMVADLQDAMADAIDAAAEEVRTPDPSVLLDWDPNSDCSRPLALPCCGRQSY